MATKGFVSNHKGSLPTVTPGTEEEGGGQSFLIFPSCAVVGSGGGTLFLKRSEDGHADGGRQKKRNLLVSSPCALPCLGFLRFDCYTKTTPTSLGFDLPFITKLTPPQFYSTQPIDWCMSGEY